jgi:hypothetical protein
MLADDHESHLQISGEHRERRVAAYQHAAAIHDAAADVHDHAAEFFAVREDDEAVGGVQSPV